jgi:hypothetical protein
LRVKLPETVSDEKQLKSCEMDYIQQRLKMNEIEVKGKKLRLEK